MKKFKFISLLFVLGAALLINIPEAGAEYCYNAPNRPIIGQADVFWGDPPSPYPNLTLGPTDIVRFSLEGTFPGTGPDCTGVVALFEIFVDGNPSNIVRTAAGSLIPGSQIQGGPMGTWQWYVDWPINNRLFDGRYRFRTVALDGSPVSGAPTSNVLIIVGAGPPPPPPPPPPVCSTGFSPNSIIVGQSTTQSWTSSNDADGQAQYSCNGNLGSGNVSATGSRTVTPTTSQSCTFTVINSIGNSATCSASVTVNAPPPPPNCNTNPSCSGSCTAPTNTCSANNGTQSSCIYTAYSGGGNCTQVTAPNQPCSLNNCSSGFTCSGGNCVAPSPPPTSPPPPPPPSPLPPTGSITCNGLNTSCDVVSGSLPQIDWICFSSSSGTVSNSIDGTVWTGLSGSQSGVSSVVSGNYILTCNGPGGTINSQVFVNIISLPPPPPPGPQSIFTGLNIPNPFSGQITSLSDLFNVIIAALYYVAGPIVVIMIIAAGLIFLFSRGDSNKVQTAKRLLLYAIIGLVIILIGSGFVKLLESILKLGT